ncbi:unnamed protein product [Microthlaspi erraticum]|uniref:Reverse transcriptase domain-containing protein n=1 Tax=Microthlaspi erraticum TaxID=1685480 RepID=A0A6D2IE63_9BRAS|nr:unnamed protein product [Microthlaspi erraticum]
MLTLRLQPILNGLISENQSAFVPGRAISENVLITHEVLHFLKTSGAKKHCSMAVKTDMSKAYDRIEWDFLIAVQRKLGFQEKWINWIHQCVSTVKYSYLINDGAHAAVTPQRGIRQGDPLSPYIFILCGEVLSGLCRRAQRDGTLPGIRVARGSPLINHLLFANDTMFFCKSNKKNCETLHQILQTYEEASGQVINLGKSSITFANKTNIETKEKAKEILGITALGGQGKYLGLPEHFGRKKKDLFALIVDRIRRKAVSWSSRFLSGAGKMTMLQAVLSAIPTYTMSCFKLPISLCKRIQSAMTRFWWDETSGKKKMCWVAWKKLTRSKKDGGLGFRDVEAFNDALLAKLSWRILTNPNCLLARVLKGKYFRYTSFLEARPRKSASHGWQGLLVGRDLLRLNLGKAIGNGEATSIWNDPWLSLETPTKPMGPATLGTAEWTVAKLIDPHTKTWNKEKILSVLPNLEQQILCVKPSVLGKEDKYIWLATESGEYTSKTGYHIAFAKQSIEITVLDTNNESSINWTRDVWNAHTSQKLKVFLWKLSSGALALGENLFSRGIKANAVCNRCGELETREHMLFLCSFAKQVWEATPVRNLPSFTSDQTFGTILQEVKSWICLPPVGLMGSSLFPWICWFLWLARNKQIFDERGFSLSDTITKAISKAREWEAAQITTPTTERRLGTGEALPLHPQATICFVDATWTVENQAAGYGWLFKTQAGVVIREGHKSEAPVRSPLAAEALALREALMDAKSRGWTNLCFKSDSQTLIRAIRSSDNIAEIHGVLQDIHLLACSFVSIAFVFTPRSNNLQADSIAKLALSSFVSFSSFVTQHA